MYSTWKLATSKYAFQRLNITNQSFHVRCETYYKQNFVVSFTFFLISLDLHFSIEIMSSAYSFAGGSLRLKSDSSSATQSGKISKKHKHKHKSKSKSSNTIEAPSSKMEHVPSTAQAGALDKAGPIRRDLRTPAEIAYDQAMEKRAEQKILQKAAKSHKERVEELNAHLDSLTEYNDIPKVSWTK